MTMENSVQIKLRKAVMGDCENILQWRNAPEIRSQSFNSEIISEEKHKHWFVNILQDISKIFLIGEIDNIPIGVLRFDVYDNRAELNIYIIPEYQGKGLGSQLLSTGVEWIKTSLVDIKQIEAKVLHKNIVSHKIFLKAGFLNYYSAYKIQI